MRCGSKRAVNAQPDQKLRTTWTLFVVRFGACFLPSRSYSGPLGIDKIQTVETSVDRDRISEAAAEPCTSLQDQKNGACSQASFRITPTWSEARTGFASVTQIISRQASNLQR
jgi:hypothetical protein